MMGVAVEVVEGWRRKRSRYVQRDCGQTCCDASADGCKCCCGRLPQSPLVKLTLLIWPELEKVERHLWRQRRLGSR